MFQRRNGRKNLSFVKRRLEMIELEMDEISRFLHEGEGDMDSAQARYDRLAESALLLSFSLSRRTDS